jgi:integrase
MTRKRPCGVTGCPLFLAGLDASTFSGHSLRAGFLTSAAAKGASIFKMMDQSGHKSVDTLRGYVRDAELFKDHAGAGLP